MAYPQTETPDFTTDVIVPENADAASADSVQTPFLALGNRTQFLKGATDQLYGDLSSLGAYVNGAVPGLIQDLSNLTNYVNGGVHRLWSMSTDQMKATDNATDGDVAYDNGKGFFFYYSNSPVFFNADEKWVFASTGQSGVWVSVEYGKLNSEGGFPTVGPTWADSSIPIGKIKQSFQNNYLLAQDNIHTGGSINDFFEDGSARIVENSSFNIDVEAGDRILLNIGPIGVTNQGTVGSNLEVRYSVNGGSSWGVLARYWISPKNVDGDSYRATLTIPVSTYFMNTTATVTFCLYGMPGAADALIVRSLDEYGNSIGTYTHLRK